MKTTIRKLTATGKVLPPVRSREHDHDFPSITDWELNARYVCDLCDKRWILLAGRVDDSFQINWHEY